MSESWVSHIAELANVLFANPTRGWPRCSMSGLEYDLAARSLNGIQVESPSDHARAFGPADWFTGKDEDLHLDYRKLGLQVECCDGVITSFRAIIFPQLRPSGRDRAFRAARLRLTGVPGHELELSDRTTDRDLTAVLGGPIETAWVGGDRWHAFLAHGSLIETYHDKPSGALLEIVIGLAVDDRELRAAA